MEKEWTEQHKVFKDKTVIKLLGLKGKRIIDIINFENDECKFITK